MTREKRESYEFLSNLVLALMDTDSVFVNAFFINELAISSRTLSGIRRGEDMRIYQYVRVIRCMTESLHLMIQPDVLLKELRTVLSSNRELVVATVPRCSHGSCQPQEWVRVIQWDGVRV
ncbi:hypothetical protein AB9N12_16590 [Bacteroides sp. AN502(2024)]|uniref:hypothetical protein n=1 Tax=Bacteroides sp. AN502(2024) TaxID=3160599 RepID=UPI003514E52B